MLAGIKGIDSQVDAMAAMWPLMRVTERQDRSATWEGPLMPTSIEYRARIRYEAPYAIETFTALDVQPRVQILSPILERHPDYNDGPIPHVYTSQIEPDLPYLCLFDPYNGEWSPADLLAKTTVPWTASYLFFYEGWLAMKRWHGPGRHASEEELRSGNVGAASLAKV
jgi:hypothetical protein